MKIAPGQRWQSKDPRDTRVFDGRPIPRVVEVLRAPPEHSNGLVHVRTVSQPGGRTSTVRRRLFLSRYEPFDAARTSPQARGA